MNRPAPAFSEVNLPPDMLRVGMRIIQDEARCLNDLAARLNDSFERAVRRIVACEGCVIVTGLGKAGLIGQKIAATLASTGTPSHFLHAAESLHGDLGRITPRDLVLALSYSGETDEVVRLARAVVARQIPVITMSGRTDCTLARSAEVALELGPLAEADPLRLAPSCSSTAMLALGDALALCTSQLRGFTAEDFAQFHPGGSLGQLLDPVDRHMRPLNQCRISHERETTRSVLIQAGRPGRRTGAVMLLGDDGRLTGIFTDSDLARIVERRREGALDRPICEVMTRQPTVLHQGVQLREALKVMETRKLSELPVIDGAGRPLGIIDITDVLCLLPRDLAEDPWAAAEPASDGSVLDKDTPCTLPFPGIRCHDHAVQGH
jgi:arabinose-5-phosphate isomerase